MHKRNNHSGSNRTRGGSILRCLFYAILLYVFAVYLAPNISTYSTQFLTPYIQLALWR